MQIQTIDASLAVEKCPGSSRSKARCSRPWPKPLFDLRLDGGYGWLIVLASFLMQACSFGVVSGFGVYLHHYRKVQFKKVPYYELALIGTLSSTTIALASMVSGRICDVFGIRICTILGLVLIVSSQLSASFANEVWQLILTQGVLFGLGGALIYVPANTIVTQWFVKYRGLAVGIGAAGSGAGGFIFSLMNAHLLDKLGFQSTLRINAIIIGAGLLVAISVIRPPPTSTQKDLMAPPPFTMKLIFNIRFLLFSLTMLSSGFSFLTPLFYLPSYAADHHFSSNQGGALVAMISITSAVGRILGGLLGDQVGHLNIFIVNLFLCTGLPLIWLFAKNYESLIVFAILYGLPSGGFAGGFASVCASLFGDHHVATIMGIAYAPTGLGDILGPSIVGYILDTYHHYTHVILYIIILFGVSSLLMSLLKVIIRNSTVPPPSTVMELVVANQ